MQASLPFRVINFDFTFLGSYFATHFFMGGKKFDTAQPEGYLFGDNSDLNYLGPKPHNVRNFHTLNFRVILHIDRSHCYCMMSQLQLFIMTADSAIDLDFSSV